MSTDSGWYRKLFHGNFLEALRRIPQQTEAEADFITKQLDAKPGAKLLDVPCGGGRLCVELAKRGYSLTGVDLTAELLDDARKAAGDNNLTIPFEQRDMRDLPWPNQFDGAFCFGNSFSYLGEDGDRDFVAAVYSTLKPGGRFVLETHFCAETIFMHRLQHRWFPMGDLYFLHNTAYEPATATFTSTYTIIHNGKTETEQAHYHIYSCRELIRLFESVGFKILNTFGSLKQEPFGIGSDGMWLVAAK